MDCLECKSLEEAFEARFEKYNEARSAAYFRVSTELAAKKNVDMERARNDLEEHQLICVSIAQMNLPQIGSTTFPRRCEDEAAELERKDSIPPWALEDIWCNFAVTSGLTNKVRTWRSTQ
jgi:hypothetical protein